MEEKKSKLGILVVVIILLVIGLAFYILIDKSIINLDFIKSKDKKNEEIVEFDESILDDYYVSIIGYGFFAGPEDGVQVSLGKAYNACDCKFDEEKFDYVCSYDTSKCTQVIDDKSDEIYYLYDEVNKNYHDKFYTKEDVSKTDFNISNQYFKWDEKGNRYLKLPTRSGGLSQVGDLYKMKGVSYNGDEAKVEVYRIFIETDFDTELRHILLNDGTNILNNIMYDSDGFIEKNGDKLPVDVLTFKYDDNKYKLKEINYFDLKKLGEVCYNYEYFTKYTFNESDISAIKNKIKESSLNDNTFIIDVETGKEYTYDGYLIPIEVTYDVSEGDKNETFYFAKKDGVWVNKASGSAFTKDELAEKIKEIEKELCKN